MYRNSYKNQRYIQPNTRTPSFKKKSKRTATIRRGECLTFLIPEVILKRASKRQRPKSYLRLETIENCNYLGSIRPATFSLLNLEELGPIKWQNLHKFTPPRDWESWNVRVLLNFKFLCEIPQNRVSSSDFKQYSIRGYCRRHSTFYWENQLGKVSKMRY